MTEPAPESRRQQLAELIADPDSAAWQAARTLSRRVNGIVQREHRPAAIRQAFEALDDPTLLAALNVCVREARQGQSAYRAVLQELALDPALLTGMDYERVQRLYRIVSACDLHDVRALFLSADTPHAPESHRENDHLSMSLGQRRQAARTRDRFMIDRLIRDRNPMVIARLLDNPRLVEQDVINIAAMRPTTPAVLELVANHRRWSSRYPVRKALACNPYTATPISLNLLSTLMLQDLRFIANNGVLPRELQAEAQRLYSQRREMQVG